MKLPNRKSIRLKAYDYSQPGAYFVTVVTNNRKPLFGEIVEGKMLLNALGEYVDRAWVWLGTRYPYVELDEYVVMPNHLHGIIFITDCGKQRKSLGQLIGAFKTRTARQNNLILGASGQMLWQRNFFERIIRNDRELQRARQYIANNPLRWELDAENPDAEHEQREGSKLSGRGGSRAARRCDAQRNRQP